MEEQKLNIVLDPSCKELVVRHGEALKLDPPKVVIVDGTIDAPLRYLMNKTKTPTDFISRSHLIVCKEEGVIHLIILEHEPHPDVINGEIVVSKEVKGLDLESEKYRTPEDTAAFLRKRKHLFASEAEYGNVFASLRNFQAKVNQEIAAIKDDAGNYEQKRKQIVEHNIPKNFTLQIPIFKGTDPIEVEVEFLVNKTLDVAMFSTDLIQKLDQRRDELIDEVVSKIEKEVPDLLIMYA